MVKNEHLGQFKTGLCVFQTRPLWVETGQYRDFGRSRGRYRRRGRQLRRPYSFQFGKGGSMFGAHGPRSGSGSTFALRLAAFSTKAAATLESAVSFANLRRVAIRRPTYRLLATYTPPFGYRSRLQDVAARDLFRAESCKIVGGLFFNGDRRWHWHGNSNCCSKPNRRATFPSYYNLCRLHEALRTTLARRWA
jgi:hypothetical protein